MGTDTRDQPRGEIAPLAHVGWKRGTDLADTELEQSVTRATSEGPFERARERGRRLGGVVRAIEEQVAARSECERRHRDGF